LKIMVIYLTGLLMMKRNIISNKFLLLNNNLINKRKDFKLSMLECLKRSCKLKLERKLESKKNLKRFKRKLKVL